MFQLLLLFCFALFGCVYSDDYSVEVIDISSVPILTFLDGGSEFAQVFNPSYVVASNTVGKDGGLVIRSQNCSATPGGDCIYCSGADNKASRLTFTPCNIASGDCATPITASDVVFEPQSVSDIYGTEDPRIVYNQWDSYYYLMYTAYGLQSDGETHSILLSLAKSKTPNIYGSWIRLGPVFPNKQGSKSGALLVNESSAMGPHYLFWGDSDIRVTMSRNISEWLSEGTIFLSPRVDRFDSRLVESGPPPLRLNSGDYLFFYNSAMVSNNSYHCGFVILDGDDPTNIIQRSDNPLFSPSLDYEIGRYPYTCNVPSVVFVEAAVKMNNAQKSQYLTENKKTVANMDSVDLIRVYFGGSDAVIGTAVVQVTQVSMTSH